MILAKLHRDGEERIDRRFEVTSGAEAELPARHQQSTALYVDEMVERREKTRWKLARRDVVNNDAAGSGEIAQTELTRLVDDAKLESLTEQNLGERIVGVSGDEQE